MVLLSFDIEEFDAPLENGGSLDFESQINYSIKGTKKILNLLDKYNIKATFYCTVNFANHAESLVKLIISKGHELASHGYFHSSFNVEDLLKSKQVLEEKFNTSIFGFRMARMMKLDLNDVEKAGYTYDSSINPTWIPGRYNNMKQPRTVHKFQKLFVLPASVSPLFRIPLFWLSLHNLPLMYYTYLAKLTLKKDGYLNVYFHPWEFVDNLDNKALKLSKLIVRNSGSKMLSRLEYVIKELSKNNAIFSTTHSFILKK